MGDDERFAYLHTFVSSKRMRHDGSGAAHEHDLTLLDEGTLYAAKLHGHSPQGEFAGSGEWIAPATGDRSHLPRNGGGDIGVWQGVRQGTAPAL